MIYPHNFEHKIEFNAIRDMVLDQCISTMGEDHARQIQFQDDLGNIERQIDETMEFCNILTHGSGFPAQDYFDLREELRRIRVEGAFITQEMMFDLRSSLATMTAIVKFIKSYKETDIPSVREIIAGIHIEPWITKKLEGIIDDRGVIRDNASADLADLRKKISQKENALNRKIAQNLKIAKQQGWVARDAEVALRDGRQVIPVSASHKRQIQGLIVDESATGQTVYIEPTEALAISNEMRELKGAERREIIRILKHFTEEIRPELPALLHNYEVLGKIDFIRSKARLTLQINGSKPNLNQSPELDWQGAIHPLLYISHKKQKKKVVPLSIKLSNENRILVISGPNAGGKSVCLKTVGLLQYMVQCGFPIPVGDGSTSGVFKNLFIDIGDEQSLENDLSTYSSHLLNMKNLVIRGDAETLFLIDEFGTGTEPRLGGAIAETTLERLNEKKCVGVVTTHYSNLKLLAKKGNGIINGAMLFDAKKMEPLYQLSIGKPGSSFAFEIARKIGFPEELLDNAEIKTGKEQLDFDEQLQQLDLEKRELDKKKQEFSVADTFLSELIEKYENLKNDLESKKRKIIEDAQEEAFNLLQTSNRMIEQTIREIREAQADKKKTMELRKALWVEKEKMKKVRIKKSTAKKEKEVEPVQKEIIPADTKIRTGDSVRIPGQDIQGEVLSISGDEVVLGVNSISFRTQLDKVEKIPAKENQKETSKKKTKGYSGIADRLSAKMANFSFQLDIRGMRGEEAIEKLRNYIDDASMLNIGEVKILHGKGHGILRTLVHDYLRKLPEVKTFRDEHIERGGHGITIVILK